MDGETVLRVGQVYLLLLAVQWQTLWGLCRLVQRAGHLDVGQHGWRRQALLQHLFGLEAAYTVDGAEVEGSVRGVGYASPAETADGQVVAIVVVVEMVLRFVQAADAFVGTHPDVALAVFGDGLYVGIGQAALTPVYLVGGVGRLRETDQSLAGGYPQPVVAVLIQGIDSVRGEAVGHHEVSHLVHLLVVQSQSASEETYPQPASGIFQCAAHQVIGQVVVRLHLPAVTVYQVDAFAGADVEGTFAILVEGAYIGMGCFGEYPLETVGTRIVADDSSVEQSEPQLSL